MTTTVEARMKNGRTWFGPMWEWRPKEGWFSLVMDHTQYDDLREEDCPLRIHLRDCISAVDQKQRVRIDAIEDVDLLARAREDGWNGQ